MAGEDDLLARELGKVGKAGGKLGSKVFGDSFPGSVSGLVGYLGASLAARFLPTERHQLEIKLRAEPRIVLANVYAFLCSKGEVKDSDELRASPYPTISGLIGSGWFNMNPAIVHAEIVAIDGDVCCVVLTGAAKEGLIKQRTAAKAVNRLAEALQSFA